MAVKIGNDYMIWVAAAGGSPAYALLGGQQDGSLEMSAQSIDASHKTSGTVALKLPGLRDISINTTFVADLPDTGYTVVETAHKSRAAMLVQVRKDGAAGTAPDDVVFAASFYVNTLSVNAALNGTLNGSVSFELAAVPTTDLTLA